MSEEQDQHWQGCHGTKVSYEELDIFLEDAFLLDDVGERLGCERYATCVWGHTGLGKTSKVKQLASRPVEWRGKKYKGYDVRSVPIAQFEEMGDLHGMPDKHVLVSRSEENETRWVPMSVAKGYTQQGWKVEHEAGIRTMYAPPDWVPTEPGPCIMVMDDFNRANGRIIKGCMQFLQEYGLMSWKLPPGAHICLTANPDEQDYLVTSIDGATLQRMRSCTLKFDHKEWAVWAQQNEIDPRIISYVLAYPEMVCGKERTSPRSLSEVGRFLSAAKSIDDRRLQIFASSVLDSETVTSLTTFINRDFEMVTSPEDIVQGKASVYKHLKDMMSRKEKRIDVVGVTCNRLFAYLSGPYVDPSEDKDAVKNVQKFLTCEWLEPELRYVFVDRLNRASKTNQKMDKWFLGNRELTKLILDVM